MDSAAAIELLRPHVRPADRVWADIGAGDGLFTRALARLLGPTGVVYAIDRHPEAVGTLESLATSTARAVDAQIVARRGDLNERLDVPIVDGVLLANVLHFVPAPQQAVTLGEIAKLLRPEGRLVVIEYDNRAANRWVPYPISRSRLGELATLSGLGAPRVSATRLSAFGGVLYVAALSPGRD